MVNFIEQVYFQDKNDIEVLENLIYKWTPLKTERKTKVVNGTEYSILKVYWDEDSGMHNWCPNDDWTYPSKEYVESIGRTQPDFFEDILPDWEKKFEFKRFNVPRKSQKELERENAIAAKNLKEFKDAEFMAITHAKKYILECTNYTVGGYKECIRDAFIPFVNKFKPKNPLEIIQKYRKILQDFFSDKKFSDELRIGIADGLNSVFASSSW